MTTEKVLSVLKEYEDTETAWRDWAMSSSKWDEAHDAPYYAERLEALRVAMDSVKALDEIQKGGV